MKKKITIIGGSGFVGTNLCRHLAFKQQDFEIIDIKISKQFPKQYKFGDVRDLNSLRKNISGDVIVNLAAVHRDDVNDKSEYKKTNVDGAENIAKICIEKHIKKIVFTSTVAVYGFADPGTNENGKINPFNEYGRTKFEAEEKFRTWQSQTDNSLIIVRPSVIFGEGNRGNVFNLMYQIYTGRFLMVGNGKNKKSMAYIGNVVAFLENCISSDQKNYICNYVDNPNLSMNQFVSFIHSKLKINNRLVLRIPLWLGLLIGYTADAISYLVRKKLLVSSIRIKKFNSSTEFKSNKGNLNGFIPPYKLHEGIQRTLNSEFLSPDPNREIFFTE